MKIKIKKLVKNATIPKYAYSNDAGMDLYATSMKYDEHGNIVYGTGLAFEIPKGYVGLLFPRSSNAKKDLLLSNSVGVIDSGYRGEVIFKYKEVYRVVADDYLFANYNVKDKIGQIIILPYPQIEFQEVEELSETERGEGGFGSTGK